MTVGTGGTGLLRLYNNSTMTIGSSVAVSGDSLVEGNAFYNSGTYNTSGTLTVAGNGTTNGVLRLSNSARVNGTPSNKKTLEAGRMAFGGITGSGVNTSVTSGLADLDDNDAIFKNNTLGDNSATDVGMMIRSARTGGTWTGLGLTSTSAKNNGLKTTGLGAIKGTDYKFGAPTRTFNGRTVADTDVVVKYTYNGDTDLNGKVDGADYAHIDSTFNNEGPGQTSPIGGWYNGDFDYNGKVDGADYSLIDAAFNSQGTVILSRGGGLAGPLNGTGNVTLNRAGMANISLDAEATIRQKGIATMMVGMENQFDGAGDNLGGGPANQSVPEPSVIGLVGMSLIGAFSRRRRSR